MEKLNHDQYYDLIQKAKSNNAYLYISVYTEAKRNLIPEHFMLLQRKMHKPT
ncbi:hypothetical protein [Wenyingzhuangia fucanilytica]|uniref:hypothetical protein n=1 Tax=Wenyingzhuangia fucanilytica TaxID=1790137 RepID=UPI0012F9B50A|nr:hypothetical protein [Wenyingzhuangia fucanilytica]